MLTSCSFVALAQNVLKPNIKQQPVSHLFYLGVKAGEVNYQDACEYTATYCDKKDSAWSGFLGYQFHPNWSVELGYNDFGQVTALYPDKEKVSQYVGTMKGWELSFKGQRMLSENVTVFAKAGTLKWNGSNIGPYSSRTDNDWAPMAGIGLGYKLTPSWGARMEYQYFDSVGSELIGGSNIHFISLGVLYRFGQKKE
jgi:OOP family OmpA-OmpF porin